MAKIPVDDAIIVEHIAKLLSGADEPTAAVGAPAAAADDEIELVGATEDAADVEGERDASPLTPHDAAVNAWSARFGALGVKLSAAVSALCTNQDDIEAAEEPLRALALLLEKAPVAEDQLCMLTDMQLSQVAKLCLSAGVIEPQAAAEVRNLTKNPSGDGRTRLRCALALCRVPDPGRLPVAFDEHRYEAALVGLPPCYREDFVTAAQALRRCVESGQRVTVLLNAPSGAPVDDLARALASCVSRDALPALTIDAGSCSSSLDLMGCAASFSQAALGMVARGLLESGECGVIVRNAHTLANLKKSDGDPVQFLKTLARCGTFRDAYLGIQARFSQPLIIVCDAASRDKGFASCCAVSATVHASTRDEKVAEVRRQLDAAKVEYAFDLPECVVDGYCFDDGTESVTNCCRLLAASAAQREQGVALDAEGVAQILPAPNANDPRVWYGLKRAALSSDVDDVACALLASALDDADPASEHARRRLKVLLDAVPDGTRLPTPSNAQVVDAIEHTHPLLGGIDGMAKAVTASLRAAHPRPLLLVGPAGTGKTTLCESLSAALGGAPFVKRDFPGISASEVFGSRTAPGQLTEAAAARAGAPGVLLIDEVDKSGCCDATVLLSLLDEGRVADSFLNVLVDLSRWLVVLTANDLDKVSPYLVDRCTIVSVPGYTPEAKVGVAKAVLVKRLGEKLGLAGAEVSDDALRHLAQLDDAAGLRGFEKRLEQLLAYTGEGGRIDMQQARELFPARPAATSGVRVVMSRGGAAGDAALQCVGAVSSEGSSGVSCLSNAPAVERGITLVQVALAQLRVFPKAVQLFLAEADDLQGCRCPDAMLGFGAALALADAGLPAELERTAFFGAVRPSGEVALDSSDALEKAPFIVARAAAYGCDALVCPVSFATAPEAKRAAEHARVELIGVGRLEQAIEFVKDAVQLHELVMTL